MQRWFLFEANSGTVKQQYYAVLADGYNTAVPKLHCAVVALNHKPDAS